MYEVRIANWYPLCYALDFHFIVVTKYRKRIFDSVITTRLKPLVVLLSQPYGVEIVEQEVDLDHIHSLFRCKPTTNLPKYIRALKSSTAKSLRQEFPQIYQQLWGKAFGSPSYFLATTGQVNLAVLRKYVENQGF